MKFNWNQIFDFLLTIFYYFIVFLLIFFVIYRAYIYRFNLKPIPCMNNKCIHERSERHKTI